MQAVGVQVHVCMCACVLECVCLQCYDRWEKVVRIIRNRLIKTGSESTLLSNILFPGGSLDQNKELFTQWDFILGHAEQEGSERERELEKENERRRARERERENIATAANNEKEKKIFVCGEGICHK